MIDLREIARILLEIKDSGGDVDALLKKLNSNLTLTEQNEHLERTVQGIKDRTLNFLRDEHEALARRDDALEAKKAAEQMRTLAMEKLGAMLRTGAEAEKIMEALEQAKKTLKETEEKAANVEHYSASGMWLLGVMFERPSLILKYRDLLNGPPPKQEYTDQIGQQIIQLAVGEVQKHGDLVPKSKYVAASLAADNYKRRESIVFELLRTPSRWTPEHKRALLGLLIDQGFTPENYEQLRKELSIPWRKCPTHHTDLRMNPSTLKWTCTIPGCNYIDPW